MAHSRWSRLQQEYRLAMLPTRWNLMAAVGVTMVILAPLYFWYDHRFFLAGFLDSSRLELLVWSHVLQAGYSILFLLVYLWRRYRSFPLWFQETMLRLGLFFLFFTVTVQVILSLAVSPDSTLYILAAVSGIVVFIEPVWLMGIVYALTGGAIVIAALVFQPDPFLGIYQHISVAIVSLGSWLVYIVYDRMRFDLYRRQIELRELNRLKDAVLRATGHDLRAPLEQIRRLLAFLEEPEEGFLRQRFRIKTELGRLFNRAQLVMDNISALSDPAVLSGRRRTDIVPLRELLDQVALVCRADLKAKGLTLRITSTPEVILRGSDRMLRSILTNLIGNAIKYSYLDGVIEVGSEIGEDSVAVSVRDYGVGIEEESLHHLRNGEMIPSRDGTSGELGTGIGLSVCRAFLHLQDSDLELESGPDQGTTVRFSLSRYRRRL